MIVRPSIPGMPPNLGGGIPMILQNQEMTLMQKIMICDMLDQKIDDEKLGFARGNITVLYKNKTTPHRGVLMYLGDEDGAKVLGVIKGKFDQVADIIVRDGVQEVKEINILSVLSVNGEERTYFEGEVSKPEEKIGGTTSE